MQSIQTSFLPPTNYKGARIVAKAQAGRLILPWDHELNVEQNHAKAARAFATRLSWYPEVLYGGVLRDGSYVWVQPCDWLRA